VSGEVEAESVSGNLKIVGGEFSDGEFSTVNGRIRFEGQLQEGGDLSFETVNGSIEVNLLGKVSADFEIDTFNGRVNNCFGPKAERTSRYAPGWELQFTEGEGDGDVEISTLNGRITLCKK
jgi:DUF4097 and DUF4098 domain-containing protein YvlB